MVVIHRRRTLAALVGVLVLVWLGLGYCSGPPDAHEYQRTAVDSAQAALSAVRTVALAGADRDRFLPPAFDVLVDDQAGAVASAQQRLTAQQPPDAGTRRLRDQLLPLLVAAARDIADLRLDGLRRLGDQLAAFVERYR